MNKFTKNRGFTLLELLVVVAIIAILTTVVVAALGDARKKGGDAGVKSNLGGARSQAEVLYNTRTANLNSYTNVCNNGIVDGVQGMGSAVLAAAKAGGLSSYFINAIGSTTTATCNWDANNWAVEVPLKNGGMWCIDSTNKSIKTTGSTLTTATDYACN